MVRRHACKRAYRFRFYPTPEQEQLLRRTVGCCRKVYNLALEARSVAWTAERRSVTYVQTSAMLTQWKKTAEYSYMNEVSCVPLQQALRHLQTAFSNFFKQTGDYPRFKAKSHGGSAEYTRSAFKWDANRNELTLAKMRGPLPIRWSRTLPRKTEPSTVTVSLDAAGRWHVSILVEETIRPLPTRRNAVGIDLGVDSYAVTSDGETIANPRHYKKLAQRLEREQQALSRKAKVSNNRRKAALKVARTYARITDMRRDFLHKLSTRIIRENQTVVLEDLNVKNMAKKMRAETRPGKSEPLAPQRPVREKRAEQEHHGRRMVGVPSNARIQGRMVRTTAHNHRQVLSEHANLLPLRGEDRAEGHARPQSQGMDVPGLRNNP